jgi:hypothetical protein
MYGEIDNIKDELATTKWKNLEDKAYLNTLRVELTFVKEKLARLHGIKSNLEEFRVMYGNMIVVRDNMDDKLLLFDE